MYTAMDLGMSSTSAAPLPCCAVECKNELADLRCEVCIDPRFKDRYFTGADSIKHAKDALTQEVEKMEALQSSRTTPEGAEAVPGNPHKAPHRRITGGGNSSATPLTPAEDRIVGLLSKADYEGIDGGFETGLPVDFLETTTSVSEVVEVDATRPPPEKKTRPLKSSPETLALLEIEREKLQL
ncbi:unnamed protein product [Gadus morhua 'NCC']